MSVLIKGMEMPHDCEVCPCLQYFHGRRFICGITHTVIGEADKLRNCPLIEIPPHGRLIDADLLMREFEKAQNTMKQHGQEYSCSFLSTSQEISTEWYCVEDILDDAPTVIEAEDE